MDLPFRLPFSRATASPEDLDVLLDETHEPQAPPEAPPAGEPTPSVDPAVLQHCNEACSQRATCPLRHAFLQFSQGYDTIMDGFSPEKHADLHAQLNRDVAPLIAFLQESREACASARLVAHQRLEAEKQRVLPAVQAVLREELGDDLRRIKALLEELHPGASTHAPATRRAPSASKEVGDEEALATIQAYRESHPDNDAAAMWHLFRETSISLNQVARLSGWSKGNLSVWKNKPDARARTSLNQERAAAPAQPAPDGDQAEA